MRQSTLLSALLASTATALALPSITLRSSSSSLALTQPSSSLAPAPPSGTVLKYVALGVGTQNYTCATPSSAAVAPASFGAMAQLYNAGSYLERIPEMMESLPAMALGVYTFSHGEIALATLLGLPVLGEHHFNSAMQPTFDLFAVNAQLLGKKTGDIPAPTESCDGPDTEGAVDWLYLTDASNGDGATFGGVTAVYRIETAGGKCPTTCESSAAEFDVPYAAEYWFYGPP